MTYWGFMREFVKGFYVACGKKWWQIALWLVGYPLVLGTLAWIIIKDIQRKEA